MPRLLGNNGYISEDIYQARTVLAEGVGAARIWPPEPRLATGEPDPFQDRVFCFCRLPGERKAGSISSLTGLREGQW